MSASVYSYGKTTSGKRMCKTKVKVLGRFLLSPEEEFNAAVARQLIDKAKGRQISIGTALRVFEMGVQFGDAATFATMPIEFIKYHRLSDMIVLTNEPTILAMCIKDYDQRSIILVEFKDKVSLKVVVDVVQKRRNALLENFVRMQSTYDQGASTRRQVSTTTSNQTANPVVNDAIRDHTDGNEEPQIDSYEQGVIDNRVNDSVPNTQATGMGIHADSNHGMFHRRQLGESNLQPQTSLQSSLQDPQSLPVQHQIYLGPSTDENHQDIRAGQIPSFQPPQQQQPSNILQAQDHKAADQHQYTDYEPPNPLGSPEQPLSSGIGERNYHDVNGALGRQIFDDKSLNQVQSQPPQQTFASSHENHHYQDVNGVNDERPLNSSQPPLQQLFPLSVEYQHHHGARGHQNFEGGPLQVDVLQPLPHQNAPTKLRRHEYHGIDAHHNSSTETAFERTMSLPAGQNSQQMRTDASQQFLFKRLPRTPVDHDDEFRNRHFSGRFRPIARVTDGANVSDYGNGWWADQGYHYRRNRIFMTARKS